jgi:fructokinase
MTETATGRRPLVFGEVLFDCFPDGSRVLGGAPFNVARHLRGLGLDPLFVSRVGTDDAGDEVGAAMRRWGMDQAGLQHDPSHPTGQVTVSIADGQPSYTILPDQAYDLIAPPGQAPGIGLVYHGSLAVRRPESRRTLDGIIAGCTAPVFVDVNLREPWGS